MSSPHHHQSNGKAENAVKTAKLLLKKAKISGEDPHQTLLAWRNTPSEGFNCSPAQRFFNRRTKCALNINETLLIPEVQI